ncbi:MAG: dimethylargininase, partial [Gammaproteobacteria bacterium]
MTERSFEFTRAITRKPAASIVDGLRAEDHGNPDLTQMLADHEHYIATLRETGAEVIELSALEAFPDSVFVEDVALCLAEGAILMRPGAPSRRGEVAEMEATLRKVYKEVLAIKGPGFIEGGDILTTAREILVGRSARTDAAGIAELAAIAGEWGYTVREVVTPPDVLHFKT